MDEHTHEPPRHSRVGENLQVAQVDGFWPSPE